MNIGIAGFIDDNFGDMILRNCFTQLLRVALKNLGRSDCEFSVIQVAQPDEKLVAQADLICFPGGAMFGRTPQAFAEPIGKIVDIAESRQIPVVFSSIGMLESEENNAALTRILSKKCVRAFSVREKEELFRRCAPENACPVVKVCDPALWTEQVYRPDVTRGAGEKPVVGVNAVRGGLFSTYEGKWKLADEEAYLDSLAKALDDAGFDYRFFANGQTLDCNVLLHLADKYGISQDKLICPDTSAELVQAIADFDAVAAIRMHASVISFSLGVPSVNLVWNSKVRDFYSDIGHPDRLVEADDRAAENAAERIAAIVREGSPMPDIRQKMSLYRFIFESMRDILHADGAERFSYEQVCAALQTLPLPQEESERDLRVKIRRAEARYASLFRSDLTQKAKVRKLKKALESERDKSVSLGEGLEKAITELRQTEEKLTASVKQRDEAQSKLEQTLSELSIIKKELQKKQRELDYLNSRFVVKAYRSLAKKGQKLKRKAT